MSIKYLVCVLAFVAFSGCVALTPGFGSKTVLDVELDDKVDPITDESGAVIEQGQGTYFRIRAKAPAGVDLSQIAGLAYDWGADGSGNIMVNSDTTASTQGQAAMMAEVANIQAQLVSGLVQGILDALAPILGQHLQNQAAIDLYNAENPSPTERERLLERIMNDPDTLAELRRRLGGN